MPEVTGMGGAVPIKSCGWGASSSRGRTGDDGESDDVEDASWRS